MRIHWYDTILQYDMIQYYNICNVIQIWSALYRRVVPYKCGSICMWPNKVRGCYMCVCIQLSVTDTWSKNKNCIHYIRYKECKFYYFFISLVCVCMCTELGTIYYLTLLYVENSLKKLSLHLKWWTSISSISDHMLF